jgi:NAD-dependent SIR2 family protein deacetylase
MSTTAGDYETSMDSPTVIYGGGAMFERRCPTCGRLVKADEMVSYNFDGALIEKPNATCKKCGRVSMPFMGHLETD